MPCRGGDSKNRGGNSRTVRYKLPSEVKCKHCVVQFYWVIANSCNPEGYRPYFKNKPFGTCGGDGGTQGGINEVLADCGGDKFPVEFFGCADVTIQNGASTLSLAQLQEENSPENNGPAVTPDAEEPDQKNEENNEKAPAKPENISPEDEPKKESQNSETTEEVPKTEEATPTPEENVRETEKIDAEKKPIPTPTPTPTRTTTPTPAPAPTRTPNPTPTPTSRGRDSPTPTPVLDPATEEANRAEDDSV